MYRVPHNVLGLGAIKKTFLIIAETSNTSHHAEGLVNPKVRAQKERN
jgi:hypothetical protein